MQIIDNKSLKMADVINSIMPDASELYFSTGYFFFSGFKEIYKNLQNRKLKILVGMDCEVGIGGMIQELQYSNLSGKPPFIVRKDYYNSLVNMFSSARQIDTPDTREAYEIFKLKILDGTLEIRKSLEPDHSKVYVFENSIQHNQNGTFKGTVIYGSSNLTLSGLVSQNEDNRLDRDNDVFDHYKKRFIDLWKSSIPLVDKNSYNEFDRQVLQKTWLKKELPKPYDIYLRVLDEYFSLEENAGILTPATLTKDKIDLKYQVDAVREALQIIEKHNGVLIADVVGLGKSIIASCIAKNLNLKTIVIAPPHLEAQWNDYYYEFGFVAKVYGSGSIPKAIKENTDGEQKLIVIDEAHKFRNEEKQLYADLHKLCIGNKVLLLTATPFNNSPREVFSLIKLFQIPAKTTIQTVDNLILRFMELTKKYNWIKEQKKHQKLTEDEVKKEVSELSNRIKDLLDPLLIRRSRLDLLNDEIYKLDLEKQGISFPEVLPPIPLKYDFGSLTSLYIRTLRHQEDYLFYKLVSDQFLPISTSPYMR